MIASLDWGGSWADAILWDGCGFKAAYSVPSRQTSAADLLDGLLEKSGLDKKAITCVALTGGDRRRVGHVLSGIPVRAVDELESIAVGARFLCGLDDAVAISCGTGTAVVYYSQEDGALRTLHLGGTAVGGGTLEGLSKLLLKKPVEDLADLAVGSAGLDLTVGDIVGSSIGSVPAEATASHFAKAVENLDATPSDVAQSLLRTVAETIATVASLASEKTGCNELVFVGRVARNPVIRDRIRFACGLFGKNPHFPENGQYATAIGAAIRSLA